MTTDSSLTSLITSTTVFCLFIGRLFSLMGGISKDCGVVCEVILKLLPFLVLSRDLAKISDICELEALSLSDSEEKYL